MSYKHYNQRQKILKRPGEQIGSARLGSRDAWITETEYKKTNESDEKSEVDCIIKRQVKYVPGLIHIFGEALENCQDNHYRSEGSSTPLKKIEVTVNQDTGEIKIWNDGKYIPATIHQWDEDEEVIDDKDHYEAEIIFGYLNSSGNYDDEGEGKERKGGGLHGVGVKLTNIFSTKFQVDAFDPETQLKFTGIWKDNMVENTTCKVTQLKQTKGFTQITYTADFDRFGVTGYTNDDIALMRKRCIDAALITGKKVIFNGEVISVKNLASYVSDYYSGGDKNTVVFKSDNCDIVLCERLDDLTQFENISFVNGINTTVGGVHVEAWKKAIFDPLVEKVNNKYGKDSKFSFKRRTIESYFTMFVVSKLDNPEFEGQTKDYLSSPSPTAKVSVSKIISIMKWESFIQSIENTFKFQGMKEMKKIDGKKSRHISIPNVTDANKAGSAKSSECTLFGAEGLSAKTLLMKGRSAVEDGNDYYGAFPFRGKPINVRKKSIDTVNKNEELKNLNKVLGLRHGLNYLDDKNFNTLRYGKFIIVTDADVDGDHIKALIINYFHYSHPTLLARGFVGSLRTPIVKATVGKKTVVFYYLNDFKEWIKKQKSKPKVKYFKGLGTNTDKDIAEIFSDPRYVDYNEDGTSTEMVKLLFADDKGKKKDEMKQSDKRKEWLSNYDPKAFSYVMEDGVEQVNISDFFNNECIEFSIYDVKRSIPSVVDGLKPSQRKCMFVGLNELNTTTDIKVSQFGPKVAENSEYHHGEVSLIGTIVGMAQTFLGSNNISYFFESGQFGTRLAGGKDCSAGRYIFTHLTSICRYLFRKEDDDILEYLEEDGKKIEPKYYVPVIPTLLVNGTKGIGTGWSSTVPSYNPIDIIEWIKLWLNNDCYLYMDDEKYLSELEKSMTDKDFFVPWHRDYKGNTTYDSEKNRYSHKGIINRVDEDCYEITELPIGTWTDSYEEYLGELKNGTVAPTGKVKSSKVGYDAMNVVQLKVELANRSLPKSGSKKAMVQRLKDNEKEAKTRKTNNNNVDYTKMKVSEIKEELKKRKLPLTGKKDILIGRLISNDTSLSSNNGITKSSTEITNDNSKNKYIKKYEPHGDAYNVNFKIWPADGFDMSVDNELLKLTSYEKTTNMYAFSPSEKIKLYRSPEEILSEFCKIRYGTYEKRKNYIIRSIEMELPELKSKSQFIREVRKDFTLLKQDEDKIFEYFESENYTKKDDKYNYLINMPIRLFTEKNYNNLLENVSKLESELEYVKNKSIKDTWMDELGDLEKAYSVWLVELEKNKKDLLSLNIKRKPLKKRK
uniref:DNA topoisomerase 2 n=1 Tax=Pithovirus LCPAC101 TaxID=2506586 RepID=A0A481Z296_9VIRU|nr:MAG: DNA topoisomerase II [Pithovirus LCPAC101]